MKLYVDEIFALLVILFIRDVAQRHANQERNQTCHEDAQVVDLLVDVVV